MSTIAIVACAVCALLGWCATLEALKAVAAARAQAAQCPCQDLDALTLAAGHGLVSKAAADAALGFERAAREVH